MEAKFVPYPPENIVLIAFKLISNKQLGMIPGRVSNLLEMRKDKKKRRDLNDSFKVETLGFYFFHSINLC